MTFEELYFDRRKRIKEYWDQAPILEAALTKELETAYKKVYPKRKYNRAKANELPEAADIIKRHQDNANVIIEAHSKYIKEVEIALDTLALSTPIPIIETLELRYVVSSSTYSTQGFGASNYAKNAAQMQVDLALFNGLKAEVRPHGESKNYSGCYYQDYGVWVNTTEIGWEILKRKSGPGLKETLRLSWKRGVNPRVFCPLLPYGIEEKLGIDYFGNELVK